MKIRAKSFQGITRALLAPPTHRIYDSKWRETLTSRVLQPTMSWSAALLDVGLWLPFAYTGRAMRTAVSWAFATCQVLYLASNITWFPFFSPSFSFLSTFPVPFSLLDWKQQLRWILGMPQTSSTLSKTLFQTLFQGPVTHRAPLLFAFFLSSNFFFWL